MTVLQSQRLQKEDKEKAQGDDELSIGILHLGTEKGTRSQDGKEIGHWMDAGPGERREWENLVTEQEGIRLSRHAQVRKREGLRDKMPLGLEIKRLQGRKDRVRQELFLRVNKRRVRLAPSEKRFLVFLTCQEGMKSPGSLLSADTYIAGSSILRRVSLTPCTILGRQKQRLD